MSKRHVLREGVKENTVTRADNSPALSCDVPCSADARSEVFLVRVIQAAQPRLADLRKRESVVDRIKVGDIA